MLRRCVVLAALFLLGLVSSATAVALVPGDILVLGTSPDAGSGIIHLDPVTKVQTLLASGSFSDFAVTSGGNLYATVGDDVVRVDPSTGTQTTVSSGGLLIPVHPFDSGSGYINPGGSFIAANDESIFVARQYDQRIVRIDPASGSQSILSEGGFFQGSTVFGTSTGDIHGTVDLELGPANNLLTLENRYPTPAEVVSIALDTGVQSAAFHESACCTYLADAGGLGVSSGGRMFGADTAEYNDFFELDPDVGSIQLHVPWINSSGVQIAYPLSWNVAVDDSGKLLLVRASDLIRFDLQSRELEYLAPGGNFYEVEVVPVPEPATAALFSLGLVGIGIANRRHPR